jgi:hypothetical protein
LDYFFLAGVGISWETTYVEVSELAAVFGNELSNLDDAFQILDEVRAFWFREGGKRSVPTVMG